MAQLPPRHEQVLVGEATVRYDHGQITDPYARMPTLS